VVASTLLCFSEFSKLRIRCLPPPVHATRRVVPAYPLPPLGGRGVYGVTVYVLLPSKHAVN
jgi:hypothetical protein